MQTTWSIRRGSQWHDGAPFTSDDLRFTAQLLQGPELTFARNVAFGFVDRLETPDPTTLVVWWKRPYIEADGLFTNPPLPRHLLERPYAEEKGTLHLIPYWIDDFVGTGPTGCDSG